MNEQKQRIDQQLEEQKDQVLISDYQPEFLGMGGEQMVFAIKEHPDVVGKVNYRYLHRLLEKQEELGFDSDHLPQEYLDKFKEIIETDRRRSKELKQYFGKAYLKERAMAMKIPVTKPLMAEAFTDQDPIVEKMPDETQELLAVLRIQKKAPQEALDVNARSLNFRYLEREDINPADYAKLCAMLIDQSLPFEIDSFAINLDEKGKTIAAQIQNDDKLKAQVKDFVEKTIAYTEATNEVLDIAGSENVVFYQDEEEWKYLLLDAMYPREKLVDIGREYLEAFQKGEQVKDWQFTVIANMLNFIRTINAFAELSQSEKRLKLLEKPIGEKGEELYKAIHEAFKRV